MDNASIAATSNDITPAEKFLREMRVPYELDRGTIRINGDLDLSGRGLTELPDLSNTSIGGNFNIANNNLESLKGCPKSVFGNFNASGNHLKTLEGGPKLVVGNYTAQSNALENLEGTPYHLYGNFNIANNHLETLKGCPKNVEGNFDISGNRLKTLEGGPELVGGNYTAQYNELENLHGSPNHVAGNFWVQHNKLTSVANGPKTVGGDFFFYDHQLTSFDYTTVAAGVTHGGHINTQQGYISLFLQSPPLRPSTAATGFSFDGGEDIDFLQEQSPAATVSQTRFSTPATIRKLQDANLLINQRMNIDGFDQDSVKVKDAAMQGDWLNIELQSGNTVSYGKKDGGEDFIGMRDNKAIDAATALACASLAKSKGWDDLQLSGPPENQAMLYIAAEKHGIKVANPPPQEHIDAARQKFDANDTPSVQAPRARMTASSPAI